MTKMEQMLSAVAYLHHKGVVHRDLKARRRMHTLDIPI